MGDASRRSNERQASARRAGGGTAQRARRKGRLLALAATLLAATLAGTAVARGQAPPVDQLPIDPTDSTAEIPNPYDPGEAAIQENDAVPDTDHTPRYKRSELWAQAGGAVFPDDSGDDPTRLVADSPTTFDTDLFTIAFRSPALGFAGGSACREPSQRSGDETAEEYGERVAACERVPLIYRFTDTSAGGQAWERVDLPGRDRPGYVGAIAWLDSDRAVAVGGTGTYPRREVPREPTESYSEWVERDPAGEGRAWLYEDGSWSELDLSDQLDQGMRGMTALDFHPGAFEFGAAGALGQIWHWQDGEFTTRIDHSSASDPNQNLSRFLYRVREIRFLPLPTPQAFAVTAGCCGQTRLHDFPRLLAFDRRDSKWYVRAWNEDGSDGLVQAPGDLVGDGSEELRVNHRRELPDSIYSFGVLNRGGGMRLAALMTPGGPERDGEPPATMTASTCVQPDGRYGSLSLIHLFDKPFELASALSRLRLSTARLVDSDGDGGLMFTAVPNAEQWERGESNVSRIRPGTTGQPIWDVYCGQPQGFSDGVPDWSVGELRSEWRPGLGTRAVAFATHLHPSLHPDAIQVAPDISDPSQSEPTATDVTGGDYQPTSEEKLEAYLRSAYFELPSYSLNAVDVVGDTGTGWAVGDRGAILRLDEGGLGSGEATPAPDPPRLAGGKAQRTSDLDPYSGVRPSSAGQPTPVPPLSARPRALLPEPRLLPAGSPDHRIQGYASDDRPIEDIAQIAMSRDGTEGWGIGPRQGTLSVTAQREAQATSFFHYDGSTWTRCDPEGVPGELPADPACAAAADLRFFLDSSGRPQTVRLGAIARVPLENDADPTNDDEFEAVAVGTPAPGSDGGAANRQTILRYSDGRWREEAPEARSEVRAMNTDVPPQAVAFTAPDDGWMLDAWSGLYHFDGQRWHECETGAAECGDEAGLLPPIRESATGVGTAKIAGLVSAGSRTYLFGSRVAGDHIAPVILRGDRGGQWQAAEGGYDPGEGESGHVESLAVAEGAVGDEGWAVGSFGSQEPATANAVLLRLQEGEWRPWSRPGPLEDHLRDGPQTVPAMQVILPAAGGGPASAAIAQRSTGRIYRFDPEADRWDLVPAERPPDERAPGTVVDGPVQALAPDGEGGFWAAVRNDRETQWLREPSSVYFFHYTDRPHAAVFDEVPHPVPTQSLRFTALSGSRDGTVWAGTSSDTLYRYDRVGGWEAVQIPGWDPGRVVTQRSEVRAVAVNDDGQGLAVGRRGRIAEIMPDAVALDAAAGTLCDSSPSPPCGTSYDLNAVAVAPDGSAMTGGQRLSLLWRPAGGDFRAVTPPPTAAQTEITGVSMPSPDRAWLSTDRGVIFAGRLSADGRWSWVPENLNESGQVLGRVQSGSPSPLRAISVDASGHGYAVGDSGVILERTEGRPPWRRLDTPYLDHLTSVALPVGGGPGALIGGRNGLILTRVEDHFEVARPADYFSHSPAQGEQTGPVTGMALLPGVAAGQSEAWAAIAGRSKPIGYFDAFASAFVDNGHNMLLHYASDPGEPLLDPRSTLEALPDTPDAGESEIAFAALGKTGCHLPRGEPCPEPARTSSEYERISERVVQDVIQRQARTRTDFALFTGDAVNAADERGFARWEEQVLRPLEEAGLPALGALGNRDLSPLTDCTEYLHCDAGSNQGTNTTWRSAMEDRPAPWGSGDALESGHVEVRPVPGGEPLTRGDGAATHYAVDLVDPGVSDDPVARVVFADTSQGSLAAGEPHQNPGEAEGQARWLEQMLCSKGDRSALGVECSREPGTSAIVVSTTPTYSYGPGGLEETQSDAARFEQILFDNDATVVVSGRLGWNARYWATAPGLHSPCPGDEYTESPPEPGTRGCGGAASPPVESAPEDAPLPFVIASSAGGALAGEQVGTDGFWHGYTVVRLDPSGDRRRVIVEQRPVFDWISLLGAQHVVGPRQRVALRGYGREPVATRSDHGTSPPVVRFDAIDSPAITHRYDLLLADPEQPWLPCSESDAGCLKLHANISQGEAPATNECSPYLCLPERVGTVNRTTGELRAGDGRYPQTFAVAMLSVADKSATYPLVFEKSPSFVVKSALRTLGAPVPHKGAGATAPPPPPTPDVPKVPEIKVPAVPVPPAIPLLAAASPPEPQAPVPPAPPPPAQQPSPLDLSVAPPGVSVTPPTALIQPPTPPVNPAPPGGARREARQRQAAAQKSGADAEEGVSEAGEQGGDIATGPDTPGGSQAMSRHDASLVRRDRIRPEPSFSAYRPAADSSPLGPGALYASGLTLLAFALAAGWSRGRPTPRRGEPKLPAPAWTEYRR